MRERIHEELGRVIAEEQSHRRTIEQRCTEALAATGTDLAQPRAIEAALFESLLVALEREVGATVEARP